MPSMAKTRSGERYRAPTDQVRKQERKRENKRNKRDRQQIRHAMAKYLNMDETISKLLILERQILGLDPQPFHVDVLKKKQKVLTDMINKRRMTLQQSKDEDELKKFNDKLAIFNADCKRLATLAVQARLARDADPESIPLPAGEARSTSLIPPPPPVLKKKVDFKLPPRPAKSKPPGPPCGVAPEYSDSEEEGDYSMGGRLEDDDLAPVPIPDFDSHMPAYPTQSNIYRNPKFAPPMPPRMSAAAPYRHQYNPMGFQHEDAVISSAPQINRGGPSEASATVSAAPELRNLRKETVKLVPTQLMRKPEKKAMPSRSSMVTTQRRVENQQQAKSTDEAYNEFMKELDGLI
ncbi:unnamed protein product [Caenorhabditis bovis]|uniref:Wbp11/ELF5/Saf1 N-terminal domain-containing protein n=1 Tax=Caenorhabditis bovis TaxID=2654633 RepID=A0A8S1EX42_9PELO|nr:unnamed protein product [Caenorhabditis bovis]